MLNQLLESDKRYTFSDYFNVSFAVRDIVRGFGYTLEQQALHLPTLALDADLRLLTRTLTVNQRRTRLENEQARRSALVAPILVEVCDYTDLQLDTEYAVSVSPHLTGIVDYQIDADPSLLIVEAKESDLARGFKQLVVELIAVSYWRANHSGVVCGSVTDGERWQFALLTPEHKLIQQDQKVYSISDLQELFGTIVALIRRNSVDTDYTT